MCRASRGERGTMRVLKQVLIIIGGIEIKG
jgi:hypothetical protein